LEILLHNRAAEIPVVHQALDEIAARRNLPAPSLAGLHLALEEHLTNIISHGYKAGQSGTIAVRFVLETCGLRVEIEDDARPFDPTAQSEVDTSLSMDAKPLGGLGILMIRKSVDDLEYRHVGDRNILTMKKRFSQQPAG